jgi:serpin B
MMSCVIPLLVVAIGAGPEGVAMNDVVPGNNRFAFDLFGKVRDRPGNLVFSPYSISTALAMTYTGANGQTAREMAETLHFPTDGKALDSGFAALRALIGGEGEDRPYQFSTANALWGQQGLHYRAEFLKRAEASFGAGLRSVDFLNDPEGARKAINAWVEKQTRDKIKELISASNIDKDTDLILTNAIYFKGSWTVPFPKTSTKDEDFKDGQTSKPVPTMHLTSHFGYLEADDLQALDLPYVGNDLSMVILLPKKVDGLAGLESSLTSDKVEGWLARLSRKNVQVARPRFKVESSCELARTLASMGMPSAFGSQADFSGMTTDRALYLSAVIHKAFAEVNEEGTEAAAATAVVMKRFLAVRPYEAPVVFQADHPFLFLIRDLRSGSILFVGRVANPASV